MATTLLKLAADLQLSLAAAVSVGATTATLSSASDSDGVALPTGKYGFTIDGDTSAKEYIVCDLSGTALTGIRHISRQGVDTAGFANYHRFGATVTITDWAILSRMLNNLTGATGFDSTANIGYDGAPSGLVGNQFATVNYVLSVVSGGTVNYDTQVVPSQVAGENLTALDLVYLKAADAKWWKCDADTAATVSGVRLGIASTTTATDATLTVVISGPVTTSGLSAGSLYYASQTAGGITATAPSAPAFPIFVGFATSTTSLLLLPQLNLGPSAGSDGTPSTINKFVTQQGTSTGGTDQSQTTQNATSAVGQADTTGLRNDLAQSFIPSKSLIKSVNLYKSANTGTFTGTVTVSIQADTAGSPSGTPLVTKTITNAAYNFYATGDFLVLFATELAVTAGNLYWIVIETSTSDSSNCPNVGTNSAGGYSSGSVKYKNTTDGWIAVSTIDLYFKVNEGLGSKSIVATSTGFLPAAPRTLGAKVGTAACTTTGVAVAHGLGKVPSVIRASYAEAGTTFMAFSSGSYDVANNTYQCTSVNYNEGTSGGGTMSTAQVVKTDPTNSHNVTISSVDENIVVFIQNTGAETIAYEIIG